MDSHWWVLRRALLKSARNRSKFLCSIGYALLFVFRSRLDLADAAAASGGIITVGSNSGGQLGRTNAASDINIALALINGNLRVRDFAVGWDPFLGDYAIALTCAHGSLLCTLFLLTAMFRQRNIS